MKKYRPALRYAWERAPSAPDHSRRESDVIEALAKSLGGGEKAERKAKAILEAATKRHRPPPFLDPEMIARKLRDQARRVRRMADREKARGAGVPN